MLRQLVLALVILAPACTGASAPAGPGVEIRLAALNLSNVTYAQYTVTVRDGSNNVVSTAQIDSDSYAVGSEPAAIRYVAPCDSTDNDNTVTVSVDAITVGSTSIPASALPVAQTQIVTCTADQSTQVAFEFYALTSSGLGFFDLFIGTNVVYCAAKLDCEGTAPRLFPDSDGEVVIGFACTADNAAIANTTTLHMDDITIDCGTANDAIIPTGSTGNVTTGITDVDGFIDGATTFRGEDLIASGADNVYWNVAVGLTANATGATCTLTTKGTTTSGDTVPVNAAYVEWSLQITDGSAVSCGHHPLFGASPNDGVAAAWPTPGSAASFDHIYRGDRIAFISSGLYAPGGAYTGSNNSFGSLSDADAICNDLAADGGILGTFVAWMGDAATDLRDHVTHAPEPLRLSNGTLVAKSVAAVFAGHLEHVVDLDEYGAGTSAGPLWTGSNNDGTSSSDHCNSWASSDPGVDGEVASVGGGVVLACDQSAKIICIQVQ